MADRRRKTRSAGRAGLPGRSDVVALWRNGIDIIKLSASDYDKLTAAQQAFFFTDPSTPKTWATWAEFWAAISAQYWFNTENVVGSSTKGVAVYDQSTDSATLVKAYRYFGKTYGLLATGSVSNGLPKFSTVTGANFIDLGAGVPLKDYPGAKIVIKDGTYFMVLYVPKTGAAGTGETYGANVLTNADFASAEPPGNAWVRGTGITVAGGLGVFTDVAIAQRIIQNKAVVRGYLWLTSWDLVSLTSGAINYQVDGAILTNPITTPGSYSAYRTTTRVTASCAFGVGARNAVTNATVDNLVAKRVLSPSVNGVWAANTPDGVAGSGFLSVDASFNFNLASGEYTYSIYPGN